MPRAEIMNPTFFGRAMRSTDGGFRYTNRQIGLVVNVVRLFSDKQWRHTVTFGADCWLQSSDVFQDADTATLDAETRLRTLCSEINCLVRPKPAAPKSKRKSPSRSSRKRTGRSR